jgi:MerR family mercuric resistance operon transcriptional regulator
MTLRIGELSKRTGVHIETIRYYERIGLTPEPSRTANGYRQYEDDDLKRLNFIRRSRELGFTLEEIRGLLGLVDGGDVTCEQVRSITLRHAEDIRGKLADLERMRGALLSMAAECEGGDVPECPILETLFEDQDR